MVTRKVPNLATIFIVKKYMPEKLIEKLGKQHYNSSAYEVKYLVLYSWSSPDFCPQVQRVASLLIATTTTYCAP